MTPHTMKPIEGPNIITLCPIDIGFDLLALGIPLQLPSSCKAVVIPGRTIEGTAAEIGRELKAAGYSIEEGGAQ